MNVRDYLKDEIVKYVESAQGCKATEIAPAIIDAITPTQREDGTMAAFLELPFIIEELIDEGRIVSVCYSLPSMPYREKQFLLPAGTSVLARSLL